MVKISIDDIFKGQGERLEDKVSFLGNAGKCIKEAWHNASDRIHSYVRPERYKGFTLMEILVSVSIIAVLMGITLVGVRGARNKARSVTCASNVRNLGIAWLAYKDDNDDRLVGGYPGIEQHSPWVHAPIGEGNYIETEKVGIRGGLLFRYVNDMDVYRCPADRRLRTTKAFRSYSIAGGMNGVSPNGEDEIIPLARYAEIKSPSAKYVFVEAVDPRGYNKSSWVLHPVSKEWVDPVAVWHNSTSIGYADGHVETHKWKGKGFTEWCRKAYDAPGSFVFERVPVQDEWGYLDMGDFDFMLKGYAYKALKE